MKDAFYFSHDSNAKDDPKIMLLVEEMGLEGYGIFWVLIEILRDQENYVYPLRMLPIVARRYNTTVAKINVVINNYDLFRVNAQEFFYSESLLRRMELMEEKRQRRVNAGRKGGEATKLLRLAQKSSSNATSNTTSDATSNTVAKKRKEKKEKNITHSANTHTCYSFEEFWNDYGKKKDIGRARPLFQKLSEEDRQAIKDTIGGYIAFHSDSQYRKYPATYLRARSWEDDLKDIGNSSNGPKNYKSRKFNQITE